MRAVLSNVGSTGDIQPFVALAVELRRHGHQPVLALSPFYADRARRLGIDFAPVGPDVSAESAADVFYAMLAARTPFGQMRAFVDATAPWIPRMYRELREATAGADVLISGMTQYAGRMVHDATGIPLVAVQLTHFGVPTAYRPPELVPMPRLPGPISRALNGGLWKLGLEPFRRATAAPINRERVRAGLPALHDPLTGDVQTADLALFPVSRYVARPEPDWPARYHLTGYWFLDHDEGWQPDAALLDFLADGPAPVVMTFGSMLHQDPRRLTGLFVEAIERAGCRAIIQQGWAGLEDEGLPPSVLLVGFVPHRWLFSRAAAVVHHGGAGTSAAVFRAGVAAVVVPHIADQPMWAAVARALGVAGPAIPFRTLTAERLGRALAATLANPTYARAAALLGERVRSEDGVGTARRLIEQLVASNRARPETLATRP